MTHAPAKSLSRRLLGDILGLERHEYRAVALSFAYFFFILSSYYMLRPVREAMGVESGVQTIPYLFTTTFLVMLVASPAFGWVASRYARQVFLPWVYLFFVINMLIFYAVFSYVLANDLSIIWPGRVFFVWISVFNLFVVSVFWSFMADIYTKEQGRRLFGVISAGGSLGALTGPFTTSLFVGTIGFQNLLPISAVLLLLGVGCVLKLRRLIDGEAADPTTDGRKPLGGSPLAGITHVAGSRYLLAISVISIIASLLGTALYMFMAEIVNNTVQGTNARTRLFGLIDGATGVGSMLLQLLVVKHAVQRLGLGVTLSFMPLLSLVGFAVLAFHPTLLVGASLQALRRAVGFGFSKPTTDMLYSVVTPEEKYKAKNFIDTAVYRGGDLIGTWSVKALLASGLGVSPISLLLLPFAALWTLLGLWLGKRYRERDAAENLLQK